MQKRDISVSMAKGIAIILMVLAHAHFSQFGGVFINMFHMPLFFIMSGYCFKESYLSNIKEYSWKRVKGAYWPFVKWGLLFLLLHNCFFSLNIYNDQFGFQGKVSQVYSLQDSLHHAIRIVTSMNDAEDLIGGYWFLHAYFFASFIAFAIIWLCRKKSLTHLLSGAVVLIFICIVFKRFNSRIPLYVRDFISARECLAASFIVTGYLYKKTGLSWERSPLITIPIGIVLVILGSLLWPCSMQSFTWQKTIPYTLTAISGTLVVFSLCKLLKRLSLTSSIVTYVGDHTLAILTWHFISFKLVSLLIIHLYSLPAARLAEFPVIDEYAHRGWWMLYLAVGIAMPLLADYGFMLVRKAANQAYKLISSSHNVQ